MMRKNEQLSEFVAFDPGNTVTGWVAARVNSEILGGMEVGAFGIDKNTDIRSMIRSQRWAPKRTRLLIETPQPSGISVAGETMETLFHIGRFTQEWSRMGGRWGFVFRGDVKLCLTGRANTKDPQVNQALRDRFGGHQNGKKCRKCKGKGWCGRGRPTCDLCDGAKWEIPPGPLAGVTSHAFAAVAVACWWVDNGIVQQQILNPGGKDPRAKAAQKKIKKPPHKKSIMERPDGRDENPRPRQPGLSGG